MNNKNGFVFIETIVTVVVLSASLLLLYSSYNASIHDEEERLYYDDIAYIYRTNYVRKFLEENSNVETLKQYSFSNSYVVTIGPGFDTMFTEEQNTKGYRSSLENIYENFNINQMLLVKSNYISDCFNESDICKASTENLSYNMKNYVKSLNELSYDYYLVVEYAEKLVDGKIQKCTLGIDTKCKSYYVNLGI